MKGQYFKSGDLVVKATTDTVKNIFAGEVVVSDEMYNVGDLSEWNALVFEPYKDPQTTQPDPTTNKDTELRLECLKLAIQSNQGVWQNPETVTTDAQHYYDWITQKGE
jgi:hypothetical protein